MMGSKSWFQTLNLVMLTSLQAVWYRKSFWLGVVLFASCILVLFPFALGVNVIKRPDVQVGCLWATCEFVAALCLGRLFGFDNEGQAFDILLCAHRPQSAIVLGKIGFSTILMITFQIPIIVLWIVFFNVDQPHILWLLVFSVLFSWGSACLGAFIHTLTQLSAGRDILQPTLFFPLQTGILLAAVSLSLAQQYPLLQATAVSSWWTLFMFYPFFFTLLAVLLSRTLLEE